MQQMIITTLSAVCLCTETRELCLIGGGDENARGFPPLCYCCIPLKLPLAYISFCGYRMPSHGYRYRYSCEEIGWTIWGESGEVYWRQKRNSSSKMLKVADSRDVFTWPRSSSDIQTGRGEAILAISRLADGPWITGSQPVSHITGLLM